MHRSVAGDVCDILSHFGTYKLCPTCSACDLRLKFLAAHCIYTTMQHLD